MTIGIAVRNRQLSSLAKTALTHVLADTVNVKATKPRSDLRVASHSPCERLNWKSKPKVANG